MGRSAHATCRPAVGRPGPAPYPVGVAPQPAAPVLVDGHGRRVGDLRLSVTDRCGLRCHYCMPPEGLTWLPRAELLTYEELARLARLCVTRWGFDGIRITGGEPTDRAGVWRLVELLAPLGVDLAMTTNGTRLEALASKLRDAGLRRVNVSLDTLRRDRFRELCGRDALPRVLAGIDAALEAGLSPVKLNAVIVRGRNDDELVGLAAFARDRGLALRLIEFMPLDATGRWAPEAVVSAREMLERIHRVFPLARRPAEALSGGHDEPAARIPYADGRGEVGVIPSVSAPFCDRCDRIRITADGKLRTCLFAIEETDLRAPLRAGASDDDLAGRIAAAVARKGPGHRIGRVDFVRPVRSMSQIGG